MKYVIFYRSTSKWNLSTTWTVASTFDDAKYANMYVELELVKNKEQAFFIAAVEVPEIPVKTVDKIA